MKKIVHILFLGFVLLCPMQVYGMLARWFGSRAVNNSDEEIMVEEGSPGLQDYMSQDHIDSYNEQNLRETFAALLPQNPETVLDILFEASISSDDYQAYKTLVAKKRNPIFFLARVMPSGFYKIRVAGGLRLGKLLFLEFTTPEQRKDKVFLFRLANTASLAANDFFAREMEILLKRCPASLLQ
jgi:hypothetical protein